MQLFPDSIYHVISSLKLFPRKWAKVPVKVTFWWLKPHLDQSVTHATILKTPAFRGGLSNSRWDTGAESLFFGIFHDQNPLALFLPMLNKDKKSSQLSFCLPVIYFLSLTYHLLYTCDVSICYLHYLLSIVLLFYFFSSFLSLSFLFSLLSFVSFFYLSLQP